MFWFSNRKSPAEQPFASREIRTNVVNDYGTDSGWLTLDYDPGTPYSVRAAFSGVVWFIDGRVLLQGMNSYASQGDVDIQPDAHKRTRIMCTLNGTLDDYNYSTTHVYFGRWQIKRFVRKLAKAIATIEAAAAEAGAVPLIEEEVASTDEIDRAIRLILNSEQD